MAGKMKWKIPDLRRAIQVAHSQGLVITGCEIGRDGTLSIRTRDCTRDEVAAPPASDVNEAAA